MEVTPYSTLHKLHWLPVKFCCKYKMGTFASCHINSTLQPYLSALLCTYQTPSTPQSSSEKLLKIQKQNLKLYGECSYSLTFHKYGIYCLPAWRIPPPPPHSIWVQSQVQELSCLDKPAHKSRSRWSILVSPDCVHVCTCMWMCEWDMLAPGVLALQIDLCFFWSHPLSLLFLSRKKKGSSTATTKVLNWEASLKGRNKWHSNFPSTQSKVRPKKHCCQF